MRPIREYPPQSHLTPSRDTPNLWDEATCRQPGLAFLFDLELDSNGNWQLSETKAQREARHQEAIALCRECPALKLCRALPTEGRAGVIAGRVIR